MKLLLFLFMLSSLGCSGQLKEDRQSSTANTKAPKDRAESIDINGVKFEIENHTLPSHSVTGSTYSCLPAYSKIAAKDFDEELAFVRKETIVLKSTGAINAHLNDSLFYLSVLREFGNLDSIAEKMEGLQFERIQKSVVSGYGACYIATFSFTHASAAGQDKIYISVNPVKQETIIWFFSDLAVSEKAGSRIIADFKVRNNKHTSIILEYDSTIAVFIPVCYKSINTETE